MSTPCGKILFVDDDKSLREVMKLALESFGFQVTEANSHAQAIDVLKRESFSIVLTDLVMETDESGLSLCKDINNLYPNLPVIILTGFPSFVVAALSASVGAYDFLTKPFDIRDLLTIILSALNAS